MHIRRKLVATGVAAALSTLSGAAIATNGMNLEGYGPIATAMGGASMAYDNGVSAVMNNPATLSMMPEGSRLDLAVGFLGPDVEANMNMGTSEYKWPSGGDSYYMPAAGWITNNGQFSYGVGMFAQGGMGTEFGNGGPGATFASFGNINPQMPMGFTGGGTLSADVSTQISRLEERSELGVARLIAPFSTRINDRLTVGGSIDWVRANLDIKMVMPGSSFANLMRSGRVSGSMTTMFGEMFGPNPGQMSDLYAAYLDFSDNSDYDGEAVGSGFGGKLGLTYQVSPDLTIGATYHTKTALSDLEGSATMQMAVEMVQDPAGNSGTDMLIPLSGNISVVDFEWPSCLAVGVAYQANDRLFLAADIKRVNWSEVMENFTVRFDSDNSASNQQFGLNNLSMTVSMPQNWDDQMVYRVGGAYQIEDDLVVRAGYNYASNPIPNGTLNYLFPAVVERHYTVGFGYDVTDVDQINFAFSHAPEVTFTGTGTDNNGLKVSHSQSNWSLMYSRMF